MRPPSPSIPEKEFFISALSQSLRIDGRALFEMREPTLIFGTELGWVECSLGKTRVIAMVDAKMVRPTPERPFEGIVSIHSELSPMASSEYESGRPSDNEVLITRMLDKVLRRSDTIDKESLCILAGQRVWHIRLTLHVLSDSGNMLDCACLAGIVALKHFRRPDVEVVGDEVTVHDPSERAPIPLSLHHTPLCLTFAYFTPPSSTYASKTATSTATPTPLILLDPTTLEQSLAEGTLSIALTKHSELCVVQKAGGIPLSVEEIMTLVKVGVERVREVDAFLERRLKEDWAGRNVEVR